MTITPITAGILALLLLVLSVLVVVGRGKLKILFGDGGDETLRRRQRAQGNFTEYVPMALILMLLMETGEIGPGWLLMSMAVVLVLARLWHAQGMLSNVPLSAGRVWGTSATWLVILVGAVATVGRGAGVW